MSDTLTEQIIGSAIEVHRELGPELREAIYENALCVEFEPRNIPYQRQVPFEVMYKGRAIGTQILDLVVAGEVVNELKSLTKLPEVTSAQVISQLRASGLSRALLLNFGEAWLVDGIKRFTL